MTSATVKALRAIGGERELSPAELVLVALAERTARTCDAAYRADDARLQLAAAEKLIGLLARLTPAPVPPPPGGAHDGDHAGASLDAELTELLAGGPAPVRDSADS